MEKIKLICRIDDGVPSYYCDAENIEVVTLYVDYFTDTPFEVYEAEVRPLAALLSRSDHDMIADATDSPEVRESYEMALNTLSDAGFPV